MMNRSSPYLLAFITLLLHLLFASGIYDMEVDDIEHGVGTVLIAATSQASQDEISPFDWQNSKHFEALTQKFEKIAERELPHIITQLNSAIEGQDEFFESEHQSALDGIKMRMVKWMNIVTSKKKKD